MDDLTKKILLKFDEVKRYETPSNFDYEALWSRVLILAKDLQSLFGLEFKIDNQVQDASFFGDIIIPHDLVINPEPNYLYSIRISNFGSLATLTFDESYSNTIKDKIIHKLEKHSFIFISSDDLEEEYDGNFLKFNKIIGGEKPSWWIRYFDYL